MKFSRGLSLLALASCLAAGCVSEPAEPDTTVFGHVDKPNKRMKSLPKPKPPEEQPVGL